MHLHVLSLNQKHIKEHSIARFCDFTLRYEWFIKNLLEYFELKEVLCSSGHQVIIPSSIDIQIKWLDEHNINFLDFEGWQKKILEIQYLFYNPAQITIYGELDKEHLPDSITEASFKALASAHKKRVSI